MLLGAAVALLLGAAFSPAATTPTASSASAASATEAGQKVLWHEVKRGDTLYGLAVRYGTDVATIQETNGLSGNLIRVGQQLLIVPGGSQMYRVKAGDTLWTIAESLGSTVQDVTLANGLKDPNRIAVGDLLLVPATVTPEGANYKPASAGTATIVRFIWPVKGAITSAFGMRDGEMHNGIDIAANYGDRILATADGTVAGTGWISGYGQTVIIAHASGYRTLYAHIQKALVKAGKPVKQGQVIALVGSTGKSTGPHLHFEVSRNAKRIDPVTSLSP
ncbi:MAG TPA: M23 family metallopeptidase [Bacillota bacterium]